MADREYERGCLVDKVDETTSNVSRDFVVTNLMFLIG